MKASPPVGTQSTPRSRASRKVLLLWAFFRPHPLGIALAVRGAAFAKHLRRLGYEVIVAVPAYPDMPPPAGAIPIETLESLRHRFGRIQALIRLPRALLGLVRFVRRMQPDVIVVSQPTYTLPIQGLIASKVAGIPMVLDMQDIFLQERDFFPKDWTSEIKLSIEGIVCRFSNRIIAVLPEMARLACRGHRVPSAKFDVLYNGVDLEEVVLDMDSQGGKDIDLLHLGAPRPYYGTERFVEAIGTLAKERPSTRVVFTDFQGTEYQKSIVELVRAKGLERTVRFLSQLSSEEVIQLMYRSKVGVYTSYGSPNSRVVVGTKVFEYMAYGLPVAYLGAEDNEAARIIREAGAGEIANTPSEFAERVRRLIEDEGLRASIRQNALLAAAQYDWGKSVPIVFQRHVGPLMNVR